MSGTVSAQPAARFAAYGTTAGALDIALAWDETRRCCDMVWENGDFALDTTPVTSMILALGCDRRARPNDVLPEPAAYATPQPGQPSLLLNLRRGWPGDALDPVGDRTGSRIWLYSRSKQLEAVRKGIEGAAAEALAQVQRVLGVSIQLAVRWIGPGAVGIRATAGGAVLDVTRTVGG
jgi:phage gp46-like protein